MLHYKALRNQVASVQVKITGSYTDLQQHPLVSQQGRSCPTVCYATVEVWQVCRHDQLVSSLASDVIMLKQMSSGLTPAKLGKSCLQKSHSS
jgi:hypothetical protein